MHELSITESLLKTACEYAEKNQAKRVTILNLVIGDLSGVMDESVQFYWDMISENTVCERALLKFDKKKAVIHCENCVNEYDLNGELMPCPECGSMNIKILAGREFLLDSIEIEK
jgi:hydrogenase nickel incorporation protein HypA/HybF